MPEQGSSFIPKSGIKTVKRPGTTRRIYLLAYVSYTVFFSTLFVVIGVYIYGAAVSGSLNSLKAQMVAERQRFSLADVDDIERLNQRLTTAKRLLDESSAPSRIFTDIENVVASNIYFSGMSYEVLPNRRFQLSLTGRAEDFDQIIGQQLLVKSNPLLRDAAVVDYDYSVGGGTAGSGALGSATISFVLSDTRDLATIPYAPAAAAAFEAQLPPNENLENVVVDSIVPGGPLETGQDATAVPPPASGS